jgi:hypothetical protein
MQPIERLQLKDRSREEKKEERKKSDDIFNPQQITPC